MVRKRRIHYTETDKAVMWDRWQKGESLEKIAQLFDRSHGSVARILLPTGGIRPPKRVRSHRTLSLAEREEISRGVVAGRSLRSIAAALNRRSIIRAVAEAQIKLVMIKPPESTFSRSISDSAASATGGGALS